MMTYNDNTAISGLFRAVAGLVASIVGCGCAGAAVVEVVVVPVEVEGVDSDCA
jgi:hypothetical protein